MNKLLDPDRLPPAALTLLRTLRGAGHEAFVVGGVVRDLLRGALSPEADVDLATRAEPKQVMGLFKRVVPTGIQHGTVTVVLGKCAFEITTYRGETAYSDGRHPDAVHFLDTIEEDLARRDFTVNAMAWDPLSGELIDPFGGQADLKSKTIRAVGEASCRFGEDGLRALRALRFSSTLDFVLETSTDAAIPETLPVFRKVAVERVWRELQKLLCGVAAPRALESLHRHDLLGHLFSGIASSPAERRRLFVERHEVATCDPILPLRIAAWLRPLGPDRARAFLQRLKASREEQAQCFALLSAFGDAPPTASNPRELRERLRVPGLSPPLFASFLQGIGHPLSAKAIQEEWERRPPRNTGELAITGAELMAALSIPPGPRVGRALAWLLDWVLDDPSRNDLAQLKTKLRDWDEA